MSTTQHFANRYAAGKVVAHALASRRNNDNCVVIGLARGGVVVAAPVAHALGVPLRVMVARKLGVPGIEEVAFGAIAEGWSGVVTDAAHEFIGIPDPIASMVIAHERMEVARRVRQYRGHTPLAELRGKTVIVVDDGLATGATLKAAAMSLRSQNPARLIAAVPVASRDGVSDVSGFFDDVLAVHIPETFTLVSDWYRDFAAVSDAELLALVGRAGSLPLHDAEQENPSPSGVEEEVAVPVPAISIGPDAESYTMQTLVGDLGLPPATPAPAPRGLVILAHGGGSSRQSYRNRYLAARLRMAGWATLRIDLLFPMEQEEDAEDGSLRFDIARITRRLRAATEWAHREKLPGAQQVVLFGSSTGAAAALSVAAALPDMVHGVICRGGRVDLAQGEWSQCAVPMLFVVGGNDAFTLVRNQQVASQLAGRAQVRIIPNTGHTFEECGALGQVGELATDWLGCPASARSTSPFMHWLRRRWQRARQPGPLAARTATRGGAPS